MKVSETLSALRQRMFTPELTETLLDTYREELEEEGESEAEFHRSHQILEEKLTPAQKEILAEMETLCAKNVDYALKFAFHRGLFSGFQQIFQEKPEKDPLQTWVYSKILKNPEMQMQFSYARTREQFNRCSSLLEEQLEKEDREHVTTVYCGWEDRLYAILRHGFYLGYRYSLFIIDQVMPIGTMEHMAENILRTEHTLGITFTGAERERRQAALERKHTRKEPAPAEE